VGRSTNIRSYSKAALGRHRRHRRRSAQRERRSVSPARPLQERRRLVAARAPADHRFRGRIVYAARLLVARSVHLRSFGHLRIRDHAPQLASRPEDWQRDLHPPHLLVRSALLMTKEMPPYPNSSTHGGATPSRPAARPVLLSTDAAAAS
jgi:hypothetical protein